MTQAQGRGLPFRTVQDYVEVPLRRPLHVLVPLAVVFIAAVVLSFVIPKKYRSSTLIFVESEKVPENFVQKMATESMTRRVQSVRQEVLSRTRLEQVIKEEGPYAAQHDTPLSDQVEQMRRSINVQTKGADAFLIEFVHTEPDKAARVANRLATLFIEEAEGEREKQAVEGAEFIDSQLKETRTALESKEEAVRRFKEQNLGNLPEQLNTNVSTLQRLQMEQQTVAESLRAAQARADLLRQAVHDPTGPVGKAVDAPSQLVQLRGQLAELRTRYTDQHPDVQAMKRRIRELEESSVVVPPPPAREPAGGTIASQLRQVELEVETLRAKRADVEAQIQRIQSRVDSVPRTEQQLATMTRDYGQLQEAYLSLLKKQMEARMAEKMERRWKGDRFKVLDPAHAPERAFSPNRRLFAIVGLFAGLALGLALAFVTEILDHSIRNAEDVQETLSSPLLIVVPQIVPETNGPWWSRWLQRELKGAAGRS